MNKTEAKKFKKEMAELKSGEGVNIGDTKYEYGADLHAESMPLIDSGEGVTVSIRVFEFKMNPKELENFPKDKQVLFNAHAKQIATILWGDGLSPLEEVSPRVIMDIKKGSYKIFVPCKAKKGINWSNQNKPKNLSSELLKESQGVARKP